MIVSTGDQVDWHVMTKKDNSIQILSIVSTGGQVDWHVGTKKDNSIRILSIVSTGDQVDWHVGTKKDNPFFKSCLLFPQVTKLTGTLGQRRITLFKSCRTENGRPCLEIRNTDTMAYEFSHVHATLGDSYEKIVYKPNHD